LNFKQREKWLKNYEVNLAKGIVDRSRLLYATMEPYLCNLEAMRGMFYAYLPAHHKQVDQQTSNEAFC
jgi:hypothetical protein